MKKTGTGFLIMYLVTTLICISFIIAGTYALFSDTARIGNHLQAGTLKIRLVREKLTTHSLAADGTFIDVTDVTPEDFTNKTDKNIFGIAKTTKIVPTSAFTADMVLTNGGDVAFCYWVEIVFDSTVSDVALASQIRLSVTLAGSAAVSTTLDQGLTLGSEISPISTVELNSEERFSVTIAFEDLDDATNNLVQDKQVSFDLVVHAIQAV